MKAAWCDRLGPVSDVTMRDDLPIPSPRPGQVLVRVRAAAVNFADVLVIGGGYQSRIETPFVPGSEFAGEVVDAPSGWADVGTRVTGIAPAGAFAEYVAVDLHHLRRVPDGLDFEHAAASQVSHWTAYHALATIGDGRSGQSVLVTGAAGGVGLATVDIARRMGLRVIAAASSDERLALTRDFGAHDTVNYARENLRERLKDLAPDGLDLVIDPVGGELSEPALRATRWGGRFVTVGFASGEIPRIPLNLVLLKGVQVRGFQIRDVATHQPDAIERCEAVLTQMVAEGLRPHVGRTFELDAVSSALQHVADRQVVGKVVITVA